MIKDAKGRKWSMRFKHYQEGWQWDARCGNHGQSSGENLFATKALAEANARHSIQSFDAIAAGGEYFRRLRKRGSECQLTADDHKAIARAGGRMPG
jgi:hypothetical protein